MNLEQIDIEINKQLELLKNEVKLIDLEEICEFKIDEAGEKIPWNDLVYKGIYLFEIKNDNQFTDFDSWIKNFKEVWESDNYLKKFTPNTKKIRIKAHTELNDWIPIYIGKSRNIGSRIHGHIYKELHKTTLFPLDNVNEKAEKPNHFIVFLSFLNKMDEISVVPEMFVIPHNKIKDFLYQNPKGNRKGINLSMLRNSANEYKNNWNQLK